MIEKKSPKGNLEKRKTTFLIIGFVVVLCLVYVAFEFFASKPKPKNLGVLDPIEIIIEEKTIATDKTPPPPPKPATDIELNIRPDDYEVDNETLFPEYDPNEAVPDINYEIEMITEVTEPQPVVSFPDVMPEPIGGMDAMYVYLRANLKYPQRALENYIQGQVAIEFVVEKDGSISEVKVLSGVFPDLDNEALRVVKAMPKWKPGIQNGKPVRCLYSIPIRFSINK